MLCCLWKYLVECYLDAFVCVLNAWNIFHKQQKKSKTVLITSISTLLTGYSLSLVQVNLFQKILLTYTMFMNGKTFTFGWCFRGFMLEFNTN